MKVSEILQRKGSKVWTIAPVDTVLGALELMAEKRIGALVVTEESVPIGIFSERDYARKVVLRGRSSRTSQVAEVMTSDPCCIPPERTAEECMALMTEKRIRHLPVVVERQLVGIISIGDIVKTVLADREFAIQQLESYISGG
jgi:CBS domain-containing protein